MCNTRDGAPPFLVAAAPGSMRPLCHGVDSGGGPSRPHPTPSRGSSLHAVGWNACGGRRPGGWQMCELGDQ